MVVDGTHTTITSAIAATICVAHVRSYGLPETVAGTALLIAGAALVSTAVFALGGYVWVGVKNYYRSR